MILCPLSRGLKPAARFGKTGQFELVSHLSGRSSSPKGRARRRPRPQNLVPRICARMTDPPSRDTRKLRATMRRNDDGLRPVARFSEPYRYWRAEAATAVARRSRPHRMLSGLREVRRLASRLCRLDEPVRVSSRRLGPIRAARTGLIPRVWNVDTHLQSPSRAGKTTAGAEPLVYRVQRTPAGLRTKNTPGAGRALPALVTPLGAGR